MQIELSRKVKRAKAGRPKIADILAKIKEKKPLSFREQLEYNIHKMKRQRAESDAKYQALIDQLYAEIPPLEKQLAGMIKDQEKLEKDALKARNQQLEKELSKVNLNLPTIQDITDKAITMDQYHEIRTQARQERQRITNEANQNFEELRDTLREKAEIILRKQHDLDEKKAAVRYYAAQMQQSYIDLLDMEKQLAIEDQAGILGDDKHAQQGRIQEQAQLIRNIESHEIIYARRLDNLDLEGMECLIFKPWIPEKYIPELLDQLQEMAQTYAHEPRQRFTVRINRAMPHQGAGVEITPNGGNPRLEIETRATMPQPITSNTPAANPTIDRSSIGVLSVEGPTVTTLNMPGKQRPAEIEDGQTIMELDLKSGKRTYKDGRKTK